METPVKHLKDKIFDNVNKNQINVTPMKIPGSPFLEKLGFGTGVHVFRLKREQPAASSPWAIKCVARPKTSEQAKRVKLFTERIEKEAECLRSLNHPNVVGFRAFKLSNDGRECLAMEDCNGSLGDLLELKLDAGEGPLSVENMNKVCLDISNAMDYLHTTAFILHADIKSFNVLIKGDFEICKLCDFGVSLPVDKDGFLDLVKKPDAVFIGTDIWSAPEAMASPLNVSTKADIYSYGLVIYEMFALSPPYATDANTSTIIITSDDETCSDLDSSHNNLSLTQLYGRRPVIPNINEISENYNHILELFYVCTNEDPEARPTAKMIVDMLHEKIKD